MCSSQLLTVTEPKLPKTLQFSLYFKITFFSDSPIAIHLSLVLILGLLIKYTFDFNADCYVELVRSIRSHLALPENLFEMSAPPFEIIHMLSSSFISNKMIKASTVFFLIPPFEKQHPFSNINQKTIACNLATNVKSSTSLTAQIDSKRFYNCLEVFASNLARLLSLCPTASYFLLLAKYDD